MGETTTIRPRMATTPTEPRRRLPKEARRAQLISAAEAVFGEVGYSGATMERIATHDGVTRSLLYEHFASIEEIYLECHRTAREEMQQRMLAAATTAGPDLHDQLRAALFAYFEFVGDRPDRFVLLYDLLPADNVVVLPRYVLRADNTILTANADNELEILPVTVLRAEPKKVYLSGGIEGGTRVVITTLDAPVPGTKLAIRGEQAPTPSVAQDGSEQ